MDFDDAKENIQPLAIGRNAHRLEVAIGAENDQSILESLSAERRQLEDAIETYSGDDPLEAWFEYIFWIEQSYPKNGKETALDNIILKCISYFEHDERYRQDRRLIKIFIKYIDSMENPQEYYEALYNQGIGTMVADLYICWAHYYDACENFSKAEEVYRRGMDARAQPIEEIENAHKHFCFTMSQRILYKDENSRRQFSNVLEERRQALTSLRAHKKKHVGSLRTGAVVKSFNPGKVKLNDTATSTNNGRQVKIYDDENADPNRPSDVPPEIEPLPLAAPVSVVRSLIDSARKSENKREAGPWSNAKSKQKCALFTDDAHPNFEILEDSDPKMLVDIEPINLPDKFVKKNRPQNPTNYPVFVCEDSVGGVLPACDTISIYPNPGIEYSMEELASYRWMKKFKFENEFTTQMDAVLSDTAPFRRGPRLPNKNRPQPDWKLDPYIVDDTIDGKNCKFEIKFEAYYPKGDEYSIEEIWHNKWLIGELQLQGASSNKMNFTQIVSEDMDETRVVMGRQSVYVPRKSCFVPPQVSPQNSPSVNTNFGSKSADEKIHLKVINDPPKSEVCDSKTHEVDVFKVPDVLVPATSEFTIWEDSPDDAANLLKANAALSPDSEKTCTAQMFNQHIRALAVSTPTAAHHAERQICHSPNVRSDMARFQNQFSNDSDTPPLQAQKQLSTIMETTEYSKTNSKFSSVDTQTSTESESDNQRAVVESPHEHSKHFQFTEFNENRETSLTKEPNGNENGTLPKISADISLDKHFDEPNLVRKSNIGIINSTEICFEKPAEEKRASFRESLAIQREPKLISFRESLSELAIEKTQPITEEEHVKGLNSLNSHKRTAIDSILSSELTNSKQNLLEPCKQPDKSLNKIPSCEDASERIFDSVHPGNSDKINRSLEENDLQLEKSPNVFFNDQLNLPEPLPYQSRQNFAEDTLSKPTVDFTFLKSDSHIGRLKGDTVTSFAFNGFLETPKPVRREAPSIQETPKLPANIANFDDDDFMNLFVMSPGYGNDKKIKKPSPLLSVESEKFGHKDNKQNDVNLNSDIKKRQNDGTEGSKYKMKTEPDMTDLTFPKFDKFEMSSKFDMFTEQSNKQRDESFPKPCKDLRETKIVSEMENMEMFDKPAFEKANQLSFKLSPKDESIPFPKFDMTDKFEKPQDLTKDLNFPKLEMSPIMAEAPTVNIQSPKVPEKTSCVLTIKNEYSSEKLVNITGPKLEIPSARAVFRQPTKVSPTEAQKCFMSPIKRVDQSAYSLMTPMHFGHPQESTMFIDENDFMRASAMPHSTMLPCAETPRALKFAPVAKSFPADKVLPLANAPTKSHELSFGNRSIVQQFNEIKNRSLNCNSFTEDDLAILAKAKNMKCVSEDDDMDTGEDQFLDLIGKSIYQPAPVPCAKRDEVWHETENTTNAYRMELDQSRFILNTSRPNPFSSELKEAHLVAIDFIQYMEGLPECDIVEKVPKLHKGLTLGIADSEIVVTKWVGEGAFGTVFCGKCSNGEVLALKQQRPANLWEYYILLELQSRIENPDVIAGFMSVKCAMIGNNASIFVSDYHNYGNLLEVCNKFKLEMGRPLDEYIAMVLISQILTIMDNLHAINIIHADIKPDNFLLTKTLAFGEKQLSIQLIDFGQSIDLKMFPDGQQFLSKCDTEGFICTEMMENRPWTFQTDLYCLAVTIHVLLFGRYMEVRKGPKGWMHTSSMPRYLQRVLWDSIFTQLLNVPDCKTMPNLQNIRRMIDEEIVEREKIVRDKINEFNRALSY